VRVNISSEEPMLFLDKQNKANIEYDRHSEIKKEKVRDG